MLTVHDVSYRIFPEFFSPRVRFVVARLIGPSIRRAARVLTLSECARQDILRVRQDGQFARFGQQALPHR